MIMIMYVLQVQRQQRKQSPHLGPCAHDYDYIKHRAQHMNHSRFVLPARVTRECVKLRDCGSYFEH